MLPLTAAFIALLVKQWLNWYLRDTTGSVIDRCRDRQRRCDGFEAWKFRVIIGGLSFMLQISPFLLVAGGCKRLWVINISIALAPLCLAGVGLFAYVVCTVFGAFWFTCPYQTPVSIGLHDSWCWVWRKIHPISHPKQIHSWTYQGIGWGHRRQHPPTPLTNLLVQLPEPQLKLVAPTDIHEPKPDDVRCVWWTLWNLSDPEALDVAIRLAAMVRWFSAKPYSLPPRELIVSILKTCFDPTGKLYPWSRDRAYYTAQAILWIHVRAMCVSEKFARRFPLPRIHCDTTSLDDDLRHLLGAYACEDTHEDLTHEDLTHEILTHEILTPEILTPETLTPETLTPKDPTPKTLTPEILAHFCHITPGSTPTHLQWTSDVLLHLSWTGQRTPDMPSPIGEHYYGGDWSTIPLNVALNRLLIWCILLGRPESFDRSVLEVQNKSCVISCFRPSSPSYCFYQW